MDLLENKESMNLDFISNNNHICLQHLKSGCLIKIKLFLLATKHIFHQMVLEQFSLRKLKNLDLFLRLLKKKLKRDQILMILLLEEKLYCNETITIKQNLLQGNSTLKLNKITIKIHSRKLFQSASHNLN